MEILIFTSILISFSVVFILLPEWIRKAKRIKLVWNDMNKPKKTKVAGSGGLMVVLGFLLGVFFYIGLKTFHFKTTINIVEILSLLNSVLFLAIIGLTDDLLGWQKGGLTKKFRICGVIVASIPLIIINAGVSQVNIPFLGGVNLGLLFPLIVIPAGIVGSTVVFNFIAGFNGLEAGQGILILTAMSIVAFLTGNSWLSVISFCMVAALLGFWIFNKFPAKVFPGDVMTYPVGGLIAIIAILGNMERIAVFFFIPYIIEFFFKIRGGLRRYSFGKPNKDGSLDVPYNKIYGLEHISILLLKKIKKDRKVYEKEVVYLIHGFQILIILIGFLIFRNSIF